MSVHGPHRQWSYALLCCSLCAPMAGVASPHRPTRKRSIASSGPPSSAYSATGSDADLAKVADRLHVTRQTVYRYFSRSGELFQAVAAQVADDLVAHLAEVLLVIDDPLDAVVRSRLLLHPTPGGRSRAVLHRRHAGGAARLSRPPGAPLMAARVLANSRSTSVTSAPTSLSILAEHMVRLLQGLVLDPRHSPAQRCRPPSLPRGLSASECPSRPGCAARHAYGQATSHRVSMRRMRPTPKGVRCSGRRRSLGQVAHPPL